MNLKKELQSFFTGDIDESPETLEAYSRDASLFYIRPTIVVAPKNVDDIKRLVTFVHKKRIEGEDISLTPRAAGTDMTGGPLTTSIVVDMKKYFNKLKKIGDDYAIVEPGMYYRDFEKETLAHNLLLPSYPASRELCTVGGMVANNAGGEKTLRYGKTEQYVESLKMVLADGKEYVFSPVTKPELAKKERGTTLEQTIYADIHALVAKNRAILERAKPQVSKNSSGYFLWNVMDPKNNTFDLTKIIVGSQGTFGIITEIRFKLVRPEPSSRLLVIFLKDLTHLGDISKRVLAHGPESFESYDDNTFKLALKFFPELLHRIKGNMLRLALHFLPEVWMLITGGVPKLVLLAEFTGTTDEEATKKAEDAYRSLRKILPSSIKMRITQSKEETQEFWTIRRESFSLLRQHVKGLRTAPFIDDFSVPPRTLPTFLPKLYKILGRYKLLYTVAGHIGDGNFHIIPLMDLSRPETKRIIDELSREVYKLILSYHGSITGEHNDGLIRTPFLKQAYGEEVYRLFEETKRIFDPYGVFNPNKKVGVSLEYALQHLDTKKLPGAR